MGHSYYFQLVGRKLKLKLNLGEDRIQLTSCADLKVEYLKITAYNVLKINNTNGGHSKKNG